MSGELQSVVEVPEYIKQINGLISKDSQAGLIDYIAKNALAGDLIVRTGGVRKLRWSIDQGKSGGIRVIYFYHNIKIPIFLLTAYRKSEQDNLSQKVKNELRKRLPKIVELYEKR